jgi:hypothetical protein
MNLQLNRPNPPFVSTSLRRFTGYDLMAQLLILVPDLIWLPEGLMRMMEGYHDEHGIGFGRVFALTFTVSGLDRQHARELMDGFLTALDDTTR